MESPEPYGAAVAVDVGGTKLAVALVEPDGRVAWTATEATPTDGDGERLWSVVEAMVRAAATHGEPVVCGAGCGGPMTPGGTAVSPLHIPAWRDFPLRDRLAGATGLPVAVDNDAKALALAEGRFGAAVGVRNYMSMVVSTGIGGGIVVDGRLLAGRTGNAGHVGHLVVDPDGRPCRCGGRGCLEAEASGTSIAAMTGRPAAEAGPETVERVGRMVGRAVAGVANLLDLDLVTVAGSVALGYGEPFFAAATAEMGDRARLGFSAGCRIVPTPMGPTGPLLGAACVGWAAAEPAAPGAAPEIAVAGPGGHR